MNSGATIVFAPTRLLPVRIQISRVSDRTALHRTALSFPTGSSRAARWVNLHQLIN